jgi:DNA repair exonuclease SbcCD ATPase subunit
MRLEFITITLENFRSFTSTQTLNLAQTDGVVFMRGRNEVEPQLGANGAGKSSVWHALCWCLYGKTPDGLRNADIKPWSGKDVPTVTLNLKVAGRPHTIVRRAVNNGLTIDGEDVGPEEPAKLIGLSFEVFKQTVLLAQAQPLFFDLQPKDKMQLFSDVLQLERWEDRSTAASTKVTDLQQLEFELIGHLNGLRSTLDHNYEWLEDAKKQAAAWEEERQQKVEQDKQVLKEQEDRLATQQRKLDDSELAYERVSLEVKTERSLTKKLSEARDKALLAVNSAESTLDVNKKERIRLKYELFELGETDECPVCAQRIKGTGLEKHKHELAAQVDALTAAINLGIAKELTAALKSASAAWDQNQKALDKLDTESDRVLGNINFLKPQIAELKAKASALKAASNERFEQVNPYRGTVQDLKARIRTLEADCKGIESDLRALRVKIERTKFWVKGFKEVRFFIVDEVLQELGFMTNLLLTEMGLQDWKVSFSVEKETKSGAIQRGITTTILSPFNTGPVKYESWSGGEGQRLRIAGALALSQVLLTYAGIETNLEVLDEPTKHLSAEGVADLCEYLSERARQLGRQCWLVDHTARESNNFVGAVTVAKSEKGSYFEVEAV